MSGPFAEAIARLQAAKDRAEEVLSANHGAAELARQLHEMITAIYADVDAGDVLASAIDGVITDFENVTYGHIQNVITLLDEAIGRASSGNS